MSKKMYEIGAILRHRKTDTIIELDRYDTQKVLGLSVKETILTKPNYNYLYGYDIVTGKLFSGLTKEFELLKEKKSI